MKERRRCFVTLSATKKEKENIIESAKKYNLSVSAYLRKCHDFYCDYINNSKINCK
ncbi:plasmid mobilization protein [Brachyspira sp.]|uniref:plasmid mobilization protein n=1 Tax=Brachyspira sp. TaxID=1977261 RepID=UPI003D7E6B9E